MEKMERLRDMLCEELEQITEQGELTTNSLEIIDKLTHSIKSIDTIMAMEEAEYSNDYRGSYRYNDRSYDDGYSRRGSYARGRNARRDSRGRYSRAEHKDRMTERLEDMMEETTDPAVKQALQKAIHQMGE